MRISDLGEKRLISEFIRPLYNRANTPGGVGDDCAMISDGHGDLWLFSTDRVPADLTAFRLGILDYCGLGRYLACLNLSDIAACGGSPLALLLNLGLPNDLLYEDLTSLCRAFGEKGEQYGCEVLGGDMTWSRDISISATSIGRVPEAQVLTRRGARPGDTVFVSKPLGLTPSAFGYHLDLNARPDVLSEGDIDILNRQFTALEPEVILGQRLSESGQCSSCMDNTDGVGQSLTELAAASCVSFVVDRNLWPSDLVVQVAELLGQAPLHLAFGAGADFSLVGTLRGDWTTERTQSEFGRSLIIIGRVERGDGVAIETDAGTMALDFAGWNYFR
jgi:thiamine-monophosphate kinase